MRSTCLAIVLIYEAVYEISIGIKIGDPNLLNEVSALFGILKYVCDIVVKKVHVRYLIS